MQNKVWSALLITYKIRFAIYLISINTSLSLNFSDNLSEYKGLNWNQSFDQTVVSYGYRPVAGNIFYSN
jgi:hypothetical protein